MCIYHVYIYVCVYNSLFIMYFFIFLSACTKYIFIYLLVTISVYKYHRKDRLDIVGRNSSDVMVILYYGCMHIVLVFLA